MRTSLPARTWAQSCRELFYRLGMKDFGIGFRYSRDPYVLSLKEIPLLPGIEQIDFPGRISEQEIDSTLQDRPGKGR